MALQAAYRNLLESGELERRAAAAQALLGHCAICPWNCKSNRLAGKRGVCLSGSLARVASFGPHHGEERVLSGWRGSGAVFFSRCNLRCIFCQNSEISQADEGPEVTAAELAEIFLRLQEQGCHNLNLVSPSHVAPQILNALAIAARQGLRLPLVYNSGGFDGLEMLRLLDGIVDIYLPDMKFSDPRSAHMLTGCKHYPAANRAAVAEMHRQVGQLVLDEDGLAVRGLIVRHLVLPNGLAGTRATVQFLAGEVSPEVCLNVMDQYRPSYKSAAVAAINRPVQAGEARAALEMARAAGLRRFVH